jgi:predicted aconitase with swiveling domain
MTALEAITLVPGAASGAPLELAEPLSFWGGFDATTGTIIDRHHPQHGACLTGRVLLMTAGRGSSSGSSVLAEAIRLRTAPAAIVLQRRDAIVATGALVAWQLYGLACPVLLADIAIWPQLAAAGALVIEADGERASLEAR